MGKKVISPKADSLSLMDNACIDTRVKKQPMIKAVKPLGGQVLVELYMEEEVSPESLLIIPDIAKNKGKNGVGGAPQGRVLDVGPGLPKEFGVKVGDRVLLAGTFVPLPRLSDQRDGDRERALVEPHTIKAVLIEDLPESKMVL